MMGEAAQHVALIATQSVMLSLALAVPAWLVLTGRSAAACHWLVVVGGAFSLVAALKLTGHALMLAGHGTWLRSPSGHVAAGCLIWGGVAFIAGAARLPSLALGFALAAVLVPARILEGKHTLAEALLGGTIGLTALWLLSRLPPAPERWRRGPFLLMVALITLLAAPWRLEPEQFLQIMAATLMRGLGLGQAP